MSDIREEALEESINNSRKEVEERYRNGEPLIFTERGTANWAYWDVPKERSCLNFDWNEYDYMIISERDLNHYKKYTDRIKKPDIEVGKKFDNGKPRWGLLPFRELKEVVDILTFGAEKYAENNWQKVRPTSRYIDATFRHFTAWCQGEKKDPESGKSHLAHVVCNILFLMWFDNEGIEE